MQEGGKKKMSDYLYTAGLEHKITELEAENARLKNASMFDSESRKIAEGVIKELKQENAELKARISRCLETIQRFVTDNEECE